MKTYKLIGRYGYNDLLQECAFIDNSQGDTSCSNNIEDEDIY